jgi:phosphonate transport system permease protein
VAASVALLAALAVGAWLAGDFRFDDLLSPRRLANCRRFLAEVVPYPLQGRPFDLGLFTDWLRAIATERGAPAAGATLAISVAAIVLAGLAGGTASLFAARTVASPRPFLPAGRPPGRGARWAWGAVVAASRGLFILARAIPEYVWAFLFLVLCGPGAWPAVLALAVHNAGIVGKLTADTVENLDPGPPAALAGLGAGRAQVALAGLLPEALNRFLLFFFYRWETCVREATVLGFLGIVSLGYWIQDARARNHYDEMFFFVLVGAALVLAGDLVSALARELVRRS